MQFNYQNITIKKHFKYGFLDKVMNSLSGGSTLMT